MSWTRLGWVMMVTGVGAFLLLAVLVLGPTSAWLQQADDAITSWAVAHRSSWLTDIAWGLTHLGGTNGLTILTVLACVALAAWDRSRPWGRDTAESTTRTTAHSAEWPAWWRATVLACAMVTSAATTTALKILLGRPRPDHDLLVGSPSSSFAFPSGHSFNTAVWAGCLTVLLVAGSAWCRRHALVMVALAVALSIGVGLSRIYLAYHWCTDVLAGWSLAIAWVGAVTAVVATHLRRAASPPLRLLPS